mmetsp:Transcript_66309/g.158634  ORF Transcript_66309/g.158634 Transcript_66309/m.158634 type:complete len:213 (+) Transcript_66309:318-956(+)
MHFGHRSPRSRNLREARTLQPLLSTMLPVLSQLPSSSCWQRLCPLSPRSVGKGIAPASGVDSKHRRHRLAGTMHSHHSSCCARTSDSRLLVVDWVLHQCCCSNRQCCCSHPQHCCCCYSEGLPWSLARVRCCRCPEGQRCPRSCGIPPHRCNSPPQSPRSRRRNCTIGCCRRGLPQPEGQRSSHSLGQERNCLLSTIATAGCTHCTPDQLGS